MKAHCGKCGQFFVCKCPEAPPVIEYGPNPTDTLTFAEAMALDPSEVEARDDFPYYNPQWFASTAWLYWTAANLRRCKFRRSRPKRSRVQEMAHRSGHCADPGAGASFGEQVIRAVCEYMRAECRFIGSKTDLAAHVERHFLEPR